MRVRLESGLATKRTSIRSAWPQSRGLHPKPITEWNVGCEKCHGPGSRHIQRPSRANIVNPARLNYVQANNVCIQCHAQGQPLKSPIKGKYYDWPVGFHVGLDLKDFWKLEDHKLGDPTFT